MAVVYTWEGSPFASYSVDYEPFENFFTTDSSRDDVEEISRRSDRHFAAYSREISRLVRELAREFSFATTSLGFRKFLHSSQTNHLTVAVSR